jgi:hypothetical protein
LKPEVLIFVARIVLSSLHGRRTPPDVKKTRADFFKHGGSGDDGFIEE